MLQRIRLVLELLAIARPPKRYVIGLALATVLQSVPDLAMAFQTGAVVDGLTHADLHKVLLAVAGFTVFGLMSTAASVWYAVQSVGLSRSIYGLLGAKSFAAMQQLPVSFFARTGQGEIVSRMTSDLETFANSLTSALIPSAKAVLALVAALFLMFGANVPLAVVSLVFIPFWLLALRPKSDRLSGLRKEIVGANDRANHVIAERLTTTGAMRVKNFLAFGVDEDAYRRAVLHAAEMSIRYTKRYSLINLELSAISTLLGQSLTLAAGVYLVMHHQATAGLVVGFLAVQAKLYAPVTTLTNLHMHLLTNEAVLSRIRALFHFAPEPDAGGVPGESGISISGLSYRVGNKTLFDGLSLDVPPGAWIGIVGESGIGKTTLATMMLRFVEGGERAIRLGGVPIGEVALRELRSRVVLVPQHDVLFSGTVRDNVAYGEAVGDDVITDVLDTVELLSRLEELGMTLDSRIGQIGASFSGGERQRFALARALVRSPQVIVLDEATSGLDVETERRIFARVRERYQLSLIVISHRFASLTDLDCVYRFEDGKLVPQSFGRLAGEAKAVDRVAN